MDVYHWSRVGFQKGDMFAVSLMHYLKATDVAIHDRSDFIHAFYLEGWVEDLKVLRYMYHHLCLHVQQLQVEICLKQF